MKPRSWRFDASGGKPLNERVDRPGGAFQRPAARSASGRHHHGRQRPVGRGTRHDRRGGPPGRRPRASPDGRGGDRPRDRDARRLRVLHGELDASHGRDRRPDGPPVRDDRRGAPGSREAGRAHPLPRPARPIVEEGVPAEDVDEAALAERLYAPELGDIDLLIRASGELRISNFLLWELAYSELVFTDTLWPDFDVDDLRAAVE